MGARLMVGKNNLLYLLFVLSFPLLNGCASTQQLKQGDVVENDYFSIAWNTATWNFTNSEKEWYVLPEKGGWGGGSNGSEGLNIILEVYKRIIFNEKKMWELVADITISSANYLKEPEYLLKDGSEVFFDKNAGYKALPREVSGVPKLMTINRYYKRVYNRKWEKITYLQGLKCIDSTFLSSYEENKEYKVYCGYYDKNKGKRIFSVDYSYHDAVSKDFNWSIGRKMDDIPHIQPIEGLLKQAVKQVINTLHIKNIDTERMKKEGLLHIDKHFELSEF